jgi:hypothetical protein
LIVEALDGGDEPLPKEVAESGLDLGENESGVENVIVHHVVPGLLFDDHELCVTNLCPPPRTLYPHLFGVLYIPFQCGNAVSCECLPPDICGAGKCARVDGNDVVCDCPK